MAVAPAMAQYRPLPPAPPVPEVRPVPRRGRVIVTVSNAYLPPPGRVILVPPPGELLPYGAFEPRFEVAVPPPVYMAPPPLLAVPALDLSGVDLDVEPPPWAKDQELPRRGVPAVVQPRPAEVAKRIEPPKQQVPPPPPKPPEPVQPQPNPADEGARLAALGMAAFQEAAYGLAAHRFQQALNADPTTARPHFLLGQAYLAL